MSEANREQQFFEMASGRGLRPVGNNHVQKTLRRLAVLFSDSLFREETARRPGALQQIDPRARLLSTLVFLVSVSLARSLPVLLAHAVLPPLAVALSRIRPKEFLGAGFLLMEEVGHAMTAREFRGEARFLPDSRFRRPEWGLMLSVVLFCAGAHVV